MLTRNIILGSALLIASASFLVQRLFISMPNLAATRATNLQLAPKYESVAVFVGGTAGIGEGMARVFAQHTAGHSHIVIVGRNRAAAEATIARFPKGTKGEFVPCDVTLMKNVKKTTDELVARLPKINFLALTTGIMTLKGRNETEEGIDRKLAVHYYARWKFIDGLLPLLRKAKDAGEDAKVITVLHPGAGKEIDLDDLGLKKHYSLPNAALSASTYNDLMVESYAAQNPDMAFTHIFPGFVRSSIIRAQSDLALRLLYPLTLALSYAAGVSADECGEYMLFALYSGEKGAFKKGRHGEETGIKSYTSNGARTKVWEHTVAVTSV